MKRSYFLIFTLIIVVSVLPYSVMGADKGWSVAVKPGIYIPQSDLKDFDTGLNGEVAVAYRFHKNLAVEGGIGFFYTEDEFTQYGTVNGVPASMNNELEIGVMPVTVSIKGILPVGKWEFYGLGGVGAYMVYGELEQTLNVGGYRSHWSGDDTDAVFGAHLGLGINYNITPRWFVGAEGKYVWTSKAKLEDGGASAKFKLDGILATAVIGFRF
jgi:outer membrane protein W